jgi:predicted amidohydrolase
MSIRRLSFVARGENARVRRAGILLVALALTGCNGGTVDRHALTNDAATIDSINCESWLLSRAVSRDRVTVYFAREQAEELAVQAANLADALAHRPTVPGLEQRVRARASDASQLSSRLWRLHDRPTDRAAARALAVAFKQAGGCS